MSRGVVADRSDLGRHGGEGRDRLVFEDLLEADAEVFAGGAGDQLEAEDGVAPEVEEVVGHPDRVPAEDLLPDRDETPFEVGAGRARGFRGGS